jgi:hypothetical protein
LFGWSKIPANKATASENPILVYGKKIDFSASNNSLGVVCLAFNPESLAVTSKSELVELAFDYIENENNVKIDRSERIILDDQKIYGDLDECRRRLIGHGHDEKPKPQQPVAKVGNLIEEINEPGREELRYEKKMTTSKESSQYLTIKVFLPAQVESIGECKLHLNEHTNSLVISTSYSRDLVIFLDETNQTKPDWNTIEAKLVKNEKTLKIKIKVK